MLRAAYTCADPKLRKKTVKPSVFFALLGLEQVKAARKMLLKLTPGQGSEHFWLMQAVERLHSELMIHSGRQFGGLPVKLGLHEQTHAPFISRF